MRPRITAACLLAVVTVACHPGRGMRLDEIDAEIHAMERRTVERTLQTLFPDDEGWIILPGIDADGFPAGLAPWLSAYRVVSPDSLPRDSWYRFLRGGPSVELMEVTGALSDYQRVRPVGFRGALVRFTTGGAESAILLVDPRGMRWVAWFEHAAAVMGETMPEELDSLGADVAEYLDGGGLPPPGGDCVPEPAWFYPPPPPVVEPPAHVWDRAIRGATPKIEGLAASDFERPDITAGRRIVFSAPPDPLANDEPFLLQRRLDNSQAPSIDNLRMSFPDLPPGEYIWAVSELGQARAVAVPAGWEQNGEGPRCTGPSVLFYGRPVLGAGGLRIAEDGSVEADAFSGEYGFSPWSSRSIDAARRCGAHAFPRLGRLLAVLPGPEQGAAWPALHTLPSGPPSWWAPCTAAVPPPGDSVGAPGSDPRSGDPTH
ncbi:MAG: hypothetical protein MUE60_15700 [Candidatus Eisenbacteria bacterium]|jgi:hypothetical protein|nr:hypothetical protein [Candidatus Eisenbacteria bacterium]